jgi:hypothetical protein
MQASTSPCGMVFASVCWCKMVPNDFSIPSWSSAKPAAGSRHGAPNALIPRTCSRLFVPSNCLNVSSKRCRWVLQIPMTVLAIGPLRLPVASGAFFRYARLGSTTPKLGSSCAGDDGDPSERSTGRFSRLRDLLDSAKPVRDVIALAMFSNKVAKGVVPMNVVAE